MGSSHPAWTAALLFAVCASTFAETDAALPEGVKAVWDLDKAWREKTPSRERVCLNGLWRWQPARNEKGPASAQNPISAECPLPADKWGYFKVPGCWPGITDYLQKDSQTVHAHPAWKDDNLRTLAAAWHQREITIPPDWAKRRITVNAECLNSAAIIYVDGKKAGNMQFPGGEVDITPLCRPGAQHVLSMLVIAAPLSDITYLFSDTNTKPEEAKRSKASVKRRGLCGDVFLVSSPVAARVGNVMIRTSVRKSEIAIDATLEGLDANADYRLRAQIVDGDKPVKEFTSAPFKSADLKNNRLSLAEPWKAGKLWDIHTPQNMYQLKLTLLDSGGQTLDAALPARFGFREFWIEGRDFHLNGTRIFLSCVPLDNAEIGAALANYAAAKETLERLKSFGINFVYTHNFGCEPGAHLSFAECLRAADDAGVLVALSQPHFGQYDWKAADADLNNGYARHAEHYVRTAGNHPAVVFYSMSHNATGYNEDMDPEQMDGTYQRKQGWSQGGANKALRAETIVQRLDPGRIVYHHSSGNLSSMHTTNFYPNFTPIQELSDWFEHWSTKGTKPVFMCEYGAPFSWDWTMYRGWMRNEKGQWTREFGSASVPWEFCLAEWNAQFYGDRAFSISEMEKANLRWESKQLKAGKTWHRWDYPCEVGSRKFDERYPIIAAYLSDNFRAYRTLGVSAISPWEHHYYWKTREGVEKTRKPLKVNWENLQRPGFSPDFVEPYESFPTAYERGDWITTPAADALIRNNRPLLAYIAGKPGAITSKDHNFLPGETVEKQLVVINNSREEVVFSADWKFAAGGTAKFENTDLIRLKTGEQSRIPIKMSFPTATAAGAYKIEAGVTFQNRQSLRDSFTLNVLPPPEKADQKFAKFALFDPKGETTKLLEGLGLSGAPVDAGADLAAFDTLIVGKGALTPDGPAPDIGRVRDGLKVIVFEQTSDVLEKRFGFRVAEYGLRNVFMRVPDHALLAELNTENLRDWRGSATLLPPQLKYSMKDNVFNGAPTVKWCDMDVPRVWRCGCRGNVASVLIEKPARGDFLPILDGGYSLQYSPLMEYREGKGLILFCQMDVSGRSEGDPAAQMLARNILNYAATWKPAPARKLLYAGDAEGKTHLEKSGFAMESYAGGKLAADQVLLVVPGGAKELNAATLSEGLKAGCRLVALGLEEADANSILPRKVSMKTAEHIAAFFEPPAMNSVFRGIGPADIHNRDPRQIPMLAGDAAILGNGVLGSTENVNIAFCQLVPWQFKYTAPQNSKRTFRRVSFLLTRLLCNEGIAASTPLLERFKSPVSAAKPEKRWLEGFYLDQPEEWDDPYRFFRW